MANAGRVAIVPKGDYSSSTAYNRLDLVRYNEKAYVAKKANTGIAPTNTEYWMLMTSDGITIDTELSDTSTNPVQNKVVKNALDSIQTTSRATLSTAGWYRVAEYATTSSAGGIKGNRANSCEIILRHTTASDSGTWKIDFNSYYQNQEFKVKSVYAADGTFTQIRYVYDETTYSCYIEVYNKKSSTVNLHVTILAGTDDAYKWQAITPTLTSETVDGVTVTTTYDIPANASPVTDLDLANYFKNTGGEVKGDITVTADDSTIRTFRLKNGVKDIRFVVNADGTFYVIDKTNNNKIFNNTADGTNTFNGTATGNLALVSTGAQQIDGNTITPLVLNNTASASTRTSLQFKLRGETLGSIGFDGANNLIMRPTDDSGIKTILHTGNSTKVVVSETAPTDTTSAWLDTTNKKTKVYIDGAWTVIA